MLRKCFYISELAMNNLIREAAGNKRNPSQQIDYHYSNLTPKEPKNDKRRKTRK